MKSRLTFAILGIFIVACAAHGQKILADVDKTFDFTKLRSFGLAEGQIAPKPATSEAIIAAIEHELKSRGLARNDAAPHVRIAVMAAADMDLQGVGPSWNNELYRSWGGYGNPGALMTVTKGTLVIDLVETNGNLSIWRGVAKDVFVSPPRGDAAKDSKAMENLVNRTVKKIFKKYPVKPTK